MSQFERWLRRYRPVEDPLVRLVCMPHAGGRPSFFRSWVDDLPATVDMLAVAYPGREDRMAEPLPPDVPSLAEEIAGALVAVRDAPVALFGHSLGAAVAYEVARRMQATRPAALLVVSGREAPRERPPPMHLMDDDELWAEVRKAMGRDGPEFDDPQLRDLFVPILRADFRLSEDYDPEPGPLLSCPVLAVNGADDPDVELDLVPTWATLSTGAFESIVLPGGHFYVETARRALVTEILGRLQRFTGVPCAWPSTP